MIRLFLLLIFFFGCAAPPKVVTLSEITENPALLNTRIQFAGFVKDNRYTERYDRDLAHWELWVEDGENDVYCLKYGYDRPLLQRAVKLADEAKLEEGMVTATGKLLSLEPTPTLEIQRLAYKGRGVNVETADSPSYIYTPYYRGPRFLGPRYLWYHRCSLETEHKVFPFLTCFLICPDEGMKS